MRALALASLLATFSAGCDPAMPELPPPPPEVPLYEGTRTLAFERVTTFGNRPVLDMDLDVAGVSAAVVWNAGETALWLDAGSGWREVFDTDDQAPVATGPTAVCISPSGDRIFVGGSNAYYWVLDRGGTVLRGPTRYNVEGQDREVDPSWPTKQCRWSPEPVAGWLYVTFSNDAGTDGALLHVAGDWLARDTFDWTRVRDGFGSQFDEFVTRVPTAYSGLDPYHRGALFVRAGIQSGSSAITTTEHTIENIFQYREWALDKWLIRDPAPGTVAYGQPRVFGRHPAGGEAILYWEQQTQLWRVLLSPPDGFREPRDFVGYATLDAPSIDRTGLWSVDVDAAGHLWVGGPRGTGWQRSTEPIR